MQDAIAVRWDDLETDHPMPLIDRQRIVGAQAMISRVTLHKGFKLEAHSHANEQFACVVSGKVRFTLDEGGGVRTVTVEGGGVLHLPAHVPHGAEALETSVVLDVFSPPSAATGVDAAGGGN